jgi:hypothetical protein
MADSLPSIESQVQIGSIEFSIAKVTLWRAEYMAFAVAGTETREKPQARSGNFEPSGTLADHRDVKPAGLRVGNS